MSSGDKKVDIFLKKFLTQQQITENFFDFLEKKIRDTTFRVFGSACLFTPNPEDVDPISSDTNDTIDITTPMVGTDGPLGNILSLDPLLADNIPFENATGVDYTVGLRFVQIPNGTEINVRTGKIKYTFNEEGIGERADPDVVVDDGDETLTITVDSVCEAGVSNAGRRVLVFLKNEAKSQAQAFEELTVIFSGGANKIETTSALGQTLGNISTTASDYEVILLGPTIKRNTDLSLDNSILYLGKVTGDNGTTPSTFDFTGVCTIFTSASIQGIIDSLFAFLVDGGSITWDLDTQSLTWSSPLKLLVPHRGFDFSIAATTIAGIADGDVLYIVRDEIGGVKPIIKVANGGVPNNSNSDPIAVRSGDNIYLRNGVLELQGVAGDPTVGRIDGVTEDLLTFMGATDESDGTPDYLNALGSAVKNMVLADDDKLTRAIKKLETRAGAIDEVRVIDFLNTALPVGTGVSIDGTTLANGDRVCFTQGAIEGVYQLSGVGPGPLVWNKLPVFKGSEAPANGKLIQVLEGSAHLRTVFERFLPNEWRQFNTSEITEENTGFPARDDSEISFVDGTRTFTIGPKAPATVFDIYQKGKIARFNGDKTVVIPDVEGLHFIYFDGQTLTATQAFSLDIIQNLVFVSTIYWDATNKEAVLLAEERHGMDMDGATHAYLHTTNGTRYLSGLLMSFNDAGDGSADSHAQVAYNDGDILDEDLLHQIKHNAAPSEIFEQILTPIANIPVLYKDGAGGDWRKQAANTFPLLIGPAVPPASQFANLVGTGGGSAGDLDAFFFSQSFTTVGAFSVGQADFSLRSAGSTGNAVLEIWGMSGGQPDDATVLGTSDVFDLTTLSAGFTVENFTFSTPVVLAGATQYALVLRNSGVTTGNVTLENAGAFAGGNSGFAATPGTNGTWTNNAADLYFEIFDVGAAGGGVAYNNPAGPWTQPDVTDTNFLAMWFFATNDINAPIMAIVGQRQDATLNDALANNLFGGLNLSGLPSLEMKILFKAIFEVNAAFTNSIEARIALAGVEDFRVADQFTLPASSPSDHGNLTGLQDKDHRLSAIDVPTPYSGDGTFKADDDDAQKLFDTLDPFFAQLQMLEHPSTKQRVRITGADATKTNGTILSQTMSNLLVSFPGAVIDFQSGQIFNPAETVVEDTFTPIVIPANEFQFYSVNIIPDTVNSPQNTINAKVLVSPANGSDAVEGDAPRAPFTGTIKLGEVGVKENGGGGIIDILQAKIIQLGVGSGAGDGGAGDIADAQHRYDVAQDDSLFELMTSSIFNVDQETKVDIPNSTAAFSIVDKGFLFDAGEVLQTFELIDFTEFIEARDIGSVDIMLIQALASINVGIQAEVSRDKGVHFQTASLDRDSNAGDLWRSQYEFLKETIAFLNSSILVASSLPLDGTNLKAAQEFVLTEVTRITDFDIYVVKVVAPVGNIIVKIETDDGSGDPSGSIVFQSAPILATSFPAGFSVATNILVDKELQPGKYHVTIEGDGIYQTNGFPGDQIIWSSGAAAPVGRKFTGVWAAHTGRFDMEVNGVAEDFSLINENVVANADATGQLDDDVLAARGQEFALSELTVLERATVFVTKTGSPVGNAFLGIFADDGGGLPDLDQPLGNSLAISISDLVAGNSELKEKLPNVTLLTGTYHLVVTTDQEYKDNFATGVDEILIRTDASAIPVPAAAVYNEGTDTWSETAAVAFTYKLEGRPVGLRMKVTSPSVAMNLLAYGVMYDRLAGQLSTSQTGVQKAFFQGLTPPTEILITKFEPHPDRMVIYDPDTGQSFRIGGTQGFDLQGNKLVVPSAFVFDDRLYEWQIVELAGGGGDDSQDNAQLLAANHLGVEPGGSGIDRSKAGRGIFLRAEDGKLYELVIKAGGLGTEIFLVT